MKLTPQQKLEAFSNRFYDFMEWEPKEGDFYTTTRNDLEVFKITKIEEGKIYSISLTNEQTTPSCFDLGGFTSTGFGIRRMHIQPWIIEDVAKGGD